MTVAASSREGRSVLVASVLGSGIAFLDSTVVNVALPRMAVNLHAGFSTMQWVLDAYLLTLGSLVLVGGAFGDIIGRKRVFLVGLLGFGVASALCGLAPNGGVLVAVRGVQGVAGALLVPGSLALITATIDAEDRDGVIGTWSGFSALTSAAGPFIGGWLVDAASWRWVFLLNLPLVAVAAAITVVAVPESREDGGDVTGLARLDLPGAVLAVATLALLVVPLIESTLAAGVRAALFTAAAVAALAFGLREHRAAHPMVPLSVFSSRVFSVANVVTFVIYGGFGGVLFLVGVMLQTGMHYSALEAGAAFAPLTLLLVVASPRVGKHLLPRVGSRALLTVGPLVAAVGLVLFVRAVPGGSYAGSVLPAILLFSIGICLVVSPITSTAMGALDAHRAGLASGVNNAVARVASLVFVAGLPLVAGAHSGVRLPVHGYRVALVVGAVAVGLGGLLAAAGLPSSLGRRAVTAPAEAAG